MISCWKRSTTDTKSRTHQSIACKKRRSRRGAAADGKGSSEGQIAKSLCACDTITAAPKEPGKCITETFIARKQSVGKAPYLGETQYAGSGVVYLFGCGGSDRGKRGEGSVGLGEKNSMLLLVLLCEGSQKSTRVDRDLA